MAPDPPKRKRGRPSNASKLLEAQSSTYRASQPRKSSSNDPKRKRTQSSLRESWASSTAQERPTKRSRETQPAAVIGRRGIPQPNDPHQNQPDDNEQSRPALASPEKPYVHVAPHTRRVRQSAIESKWTPLTNASLTAVSTTLQYAQRPILQRLSDSHLRRTHTSSALRQISHRIARKISRGLPFPPASMPAPVGRAPLQSDAGREVELNFESVLDGKLNLERQLEPALDGLEVLRREKEAMEEELEQDYVTLRNLEADARDQARDKRRLLKKAHVFTPAPSVKKEDGLQGVEENDGFLFSRDAATAAGSAFTGVQNDGEMHDLAMQLSHHVDSIRGNLEQTEGILPMVTRSKAALRAVLLKYVDQRTYERAVLG